MGLEIGPDSSEAETPVSRLADSAEWTRSEAVLEAEAHQAWPRDLPRPAEGGQLDVAGGLQRGRAVERVEDVHGHPRRAAPERHLARQPQVEHRHRGQPVAVQVPADQDVL